MVADYVLPLMIGIAQSYPETSIRYVAQLSRTEPEQGSATLHIRGGQQPEIPGATVRRLGMLRFSLFGSSGYLAQHGLPSGHDDLSRFSFVVLDRYLRVTPWERWLLKTHPNAHISLRSDCDIAQRIAVSLGQGLGFLPMSALLYFTDLVEVLPALEEWAAPMWLVADNRSMQDGDFAELAQRLGDRLSELWL